MLFNCAFKTLSKIAAISTSSETAMLSFPCPTRHKHSRNLLGKFLRQRREYIAKMMALHPFNMLKILESRYIAPVFEESKYFITNLYWNATVWSGCHLEGYPVRISRYCDCTCLVVGAKHIESFSLQLVV